MPTSQRIFDVVVLIVAGLVLVMIFFPVYVGGGPSTGSLPISLAKQVDLAVSMYEGDNDGRLPPLENGHSLSLTLREFLKDRKDVKPENSLLKACDSYSWNRALSTLVASDIKSPESVWLFRKPRPDERNKVLLGFVDGHVKYVDEPVLEGFLNKRLEFKNKGVSVRPTEPDLDRMLVNNQTPSIKVTR